MPRKLPALAVAVLSLTVTADAVGAGYATRTLQVGSSGSDVRALQRYLDSAGYDTTADGAFGPATRRSVVAFETAEERRTNGRASRAEQRMVRARAASSDSPAPAPTDSAYLTSDGVAVGGTQPLMRSRRSSRPATRSRRSRTSMAAAMGAGTTRGTTAQARGATCCTPQAC